MRARCYFAPAPKARRRPARSLPGFGGKARMGQALAPLWASASGWRRSKASGRLRWKRSSRPDAKAGKFSSLADLCERVDGRSVNRKVLEALIKSGACDCLGQTRATLFAQMDRTLARAASIIADRQRGQASLFGALEDRASPMPESVSDLPEWPEHELLAHEKELLGFYVTGHPLTPYAPILEKYALANTATLAQLPPRSLTRIGGLVAAVQNGVSKKSGKPYALVTLEDLEGSVQVLCFSENYEKYRELLAPGKAILVIGEVNAGDDKPKVFPQEIMPLEDAPARFTKQVHLRLHTAHLKPEHLASVEELVAAHPGKCPLFLCFVRPGGRSRIHRGARAVLRGAIAGASAGGRRPVRRGNLLRQGGYEFAGADTETMGAAPERQRRGGVRRGERGRTNRSGGHHRFGARAASFAGVRHHALVGGADGRAQRHDAGAGRAGATVSKLLAPLYAYVRRAGYSREEAQDLTQEFFARLLAQNTVARADPARGRFRSFLLASLKHFLANEWEKAHAQKRGGYAQVLALEFDTAETRCCAAGRAGRHPRPGL